MSEKNNISFVTLMQVIGCVLVIFGHSYPFVTNVPDWAIKIKLMIYCFHMPIFIWCSGYLLGATNQTEKYSFGKYVSRRAKRILIPYFAFSLIAIVPKCLLSPFLNDKLEFKLLQIVRVFFVPRESVWGHFWFLPMIFLFGILGYGIVKLAKFMGGYALYTLTIISVIGFFMPNITDWFSVNDVLHYAFYFLLGIVCSKMNFDFLDKFSLIIGTTLFIMSIMLFIFIGYKPIGIFLVSILMIISVYEFCIIVSKKIEIKRNSILNSTYQIFILSWSCQLIVEIVLERILGMPFYVIIPAMFIMGITTPVIIIKLIDWFEKKTKIKIKIISLMIGR